MSDRPVGQVEQFKSKWAFKYLAQTCLDRSAHRRRAIFRHQRQPMLNLTKYAGMLISYSKSTNGN